MLSLEMRATYHIRVHVFKIFLAKGNISINFLFTFLNALLNIFGLLCLGKLPETDINDDML